MKKHYLLKLFATVMLLAIALTALVACDDVDVEVTFIVDDEVYAVVNLQDGNTVKMPEDPQKEDCVFSGWYLDKDIWKKPFWGEIEDTTIVKLEVYARWGDTPCEHIWSLWTEGIPATCYSVGKQVRSCLRCGKGEVADIEMLEHNFIDGVCINEGCNATDPNYTGLVFILNSDKESYSVKYQGTCTETEIVIPAEYKSKPITRIASYAFSGAEGLTSINIPDGVMYIGNNAFSECRSLTSVNIPDGVMYIGYEAFGACEGLRSINIPDSVTHIDDFAFALCKNLCDLTIGKGITYIGTGAFVWCYALDFERLFWDIPNIKYIGSYNLPNSVYENDHLYDDDDNALYLGAVLIRVKDTSITSFKIREGTRIIYVGAFSDCENLTSITIPSSVTQIGSMAFYNCSGLISLTIPDGVTCIGDRAFEGSSRLTSITIPDSVTSTYSSDFTNMGSAFLDCVNLQFNEYENGLYLGNEENPYHLLVGVKDKSVTSFFVNEKTKVIDGSAFLGCENLQFNEYENGLYLGTKDNPYAMLIGFNDPSVTSYKINENTKVICDGSCAGEYLTSVTIPNSVVSIGSYVFGESFNLTEIKFDGTIAEWNAIKKSGSWKAWSSVLTVICTDGFDNGSDSGFDNGADSGSDREVDGDFGGDDNSSSDTGVIPDIVW